MSNSENNRILHLFGDIDEGNIKDVKKEIIDLINQDNKKSNKVKNFNRKPIKLYIDSYGGEVHPMWSLINVILNSKTPIYTYCTGYAMSAGFLLYLAGHKRYIASHVHLMYHQISCWKWGKIKDMQEGMEHDNFLQKEIEDYVVARTKMKKKHLKKIRENKEDYFMNSKEALDLGVAHEMIESL